MKSLDSNNFYITSTAALSKLVGEIKKAKLVALDTEFTRQTTYYPILSIIQVALKKDNQKQRFIIDCQAENLDLSEFLALICDDKITKILHSCSQDLQIFHRATNALPQNIADTQIMANFCGGSFNVGYSNLVESFFGQKISKDQQRSDWQRRPLSKKQIEYALLDVEFLHEIYENFFSVLSQKNRQSWFEEEMKSFIQRSLFKSEESLLKNLSFRRKSATQVEQLRNLTWLREDWSQKKDVLRQYFLKDEELEKIVEEGFVSDKNYPRLAPEMILQIEEILQSKEENFEKLGKVKSFFSSDAQEELFQMAKNFINKIAREQAFSEQFLLTSSDLKKIINDRNSFDKIIFGWRFELFGQHLKEIIS